MIDLGGFGGPTGATAITPDGRTIVGDSVSTSQQDAFILNSTLGMRALGAISPKGRAMRSLAVSTDGRVVVGIGSSSSFVAFRWTESTGGIDLGTLDPQNPGSYAAAVSADGNVIVGMGSGVDADGSGEAFVWFPNRGMQHLGKYLESHGVAAVHGWRLIEGSAIADDGKTLAGLGVTPDGRRAAWIAKIDIDDATAPPAIPPESIPAPSNLQGVATATQVTLQWNDNSANETGFSIERCTGNCTNFAPITQVGANVARFVDSGRARNTSYRYRVRAFNASATSGYSNTVSVQTARK